jgi:hypothetical protein
MSFQILCTKLMYLHLAPGTWRTGHLENPKTEHGALISLAKIRSISTMRIAALTRNDSRIAVLHIVVLDVSPSVRAVREHYSDGWKNNHAIDAANQRIFNSVLRFIDDELANGITRIYNYRLSASAVVFEG